MFITLTPNQAAQVRATLPKSDEQPAKPSKIDSIPTSADTDSSRSFREGVELRSDRNHDQEEKPEIA